MINEKDKVQLDLNKWKLEEYKLLTKHYFHEDNYFLKCTTHFGGLNAVIITSFGLSIRFEVSSLFLFIICAMGFLVSFLWYRALHRVRSIRIGTENRIKEIENTINSTLILAEKSRSLNLLARQNNDDRGAYDAPSATKTMLILPIGFLCLWTFTALFAICVSIGGGTGHLGNSVDNMNKIPKKIEVPGANYTQVGLIVEKASPSC